MPRTSTTACAREPPTARPRRAACARRCGSTSTSSARAACRAGNLQAGAREVRYDAAERLRRRSGADAIATGHTRTDLAETVLYRLAASPGSRALLGLAPRNGRVIRPLLGLERERVRELASIAGLPFADDETNADPGFARNRIRAEVLPVLRDLNPAAEREHRRDPRRARRGGGAARPRGARSARAGRRGRRRGRDRRRGARRLGARPAAAGAARAGRARRRPPGCPRASTGPPRSSGSPREPEGGTVELGGGLVAICESGFVRFRAADRRCRPRTGRRSASRAAPGSATGRCAPSFIRAR